MGAVVLLLVFLFIFGFVYPALMAALYPIYRKRGGKLSFKRYMEEI